MRALTTLFFLGATTVVASAQDFGPDGSGNGANSIPGNFTDISASGTNITGAFGANLDDAGQVVGIGFPYTLYGVTITSIGVSTNGYLADDPDLTDFTNDCPIASGITPNRGVYPFWDDLRLTEHGDCYTELQGTSPNRVFIVQWDDVGTFDDSTASLTFQAKIFECGSKTEFHYDALIDGTGPGFDASGGGATIGLEAAGGSDGLSISCDVSGAVAAGDAFELGLHSTQTVRVGAPANSGTLTAGTQSPAIGAVWNPTVTGAVTGAQIDFLIVSTLPGINSPTGLGTFLCPISIPLLQLNLSPGTAFSAQIPNDCTLLGLALCSQGGSVAFGPLTIGLANALDVVVGAI